MTEAKKLSGLASWLLPLLGANAVVAALTIASDVWLWSTLGDPIGSSATSVRGSVDLADTIAFLQVALIVVTAFVYLRWQGRGYRNIHRVASGKKPSGPVLAIIGWFIPFANLVVGYKIADAMWRATDPDKPLDMTAPGSSLVSRWWGAYLAGGIIGGWARRSENLATSMEGIRDSIPIGLVASLATLVAALLAREVVRQLTARHDALIHLMVPRDEAAESMPG